MEYRRSVWASRRVSRKPCLASSFAGAAQFVMVQLIAAGTPSLVVILTAFIVNIRHLLYSASVSSYTRKLHPLWKWLLAYLLTDEAYAVTILHYQKPGDDRQKHWYFLGAGLALWTAWQLSTAAGIFLGGHISLQVGHWTSHLRSHLSLSLCPRSRIT